MPPRSIILYNPRTVFYTMPLALLAVGSALDTRRYDVRIIDGRVEADPLCAVLDAVPDALCLGVTALTGAPLRDVLLITRTVKKLRPDLPVVLGGWHPSLFPLESLDEWSIDITIQGQGEATFREVVDRLDEGGSLADVSGLCYRDEGTPVRNQPRPLVEMNELPPVNYDLVPVEQYFRLKRQRQLDYISSAGCFWRCKFCADPFVYNRRWTAIEPDRLSDEICDLHGRYSFEELAFQDETFFTYPNRVRRIAEAFVENGLNFKWTATMRADQAERLTEDDFSLLTRAGLSRVLVGVESGSQEMLDWMSKDITIEQVLHTADRCRRHGIGAIFPFIVGFPDESPPSVQSSLDLASRLRAMSPSFETPVFYFKPYPGSDITQSVTANGYTLPSTMDGWAEFDFVGSSGPWVSAEKYRRVERFKFYNRAAWSRLPGLLRPVQSLARWRCRRNFFRFPFEKLAADFIRPAARLS